MTDNKSSIDGNSNINDNVNEKKHDNKSNDINFGAQTERSRFFIFFKKLSIGLSIIGWTWLFILLLTIMEFIPLIVTFKPFLIYFMFVISFVSYLFCSLSSGLDMRREEKVLWFFGKILNILNLVVATAIFYFILKALTIH